MKTKIKPLDKIKMKGLITVLIVLSCSLSVHAQGVAFENGNNVERILKKARQEGKYIFVDIYANWCVPCKEMDRAVYSSSKTGDLMNAKFLSLKIDADELKLDTNNRIREIIFLSKIKKDQTFSVLPTFIFLSPDGKLLSKEVGYRDIEGMNKMVLDVLNPDTQFYSQIEKYHQGSLTFTEKMKLALKAKSIYENKIANQISEDCTTNYLYKLPEKELFTKDNLLFIAAFLGENEDLGLKLFTEKKGLINKVLGRNKAEYSIKYAISTKYFPKSNSWKDTVSNWDKLEKKLSNKFGELGREVIYGRRMMYSYDVKNWSEYAKYYYLYFKTALTRPDYNINDLSFVLFENVNDGKILIFARDIVMKYAMEEWYQNDGAAYDTYANLLYKTHKTNDAIKWQEKAVRLKQGSPDEHLYTDALNKMRKNIPTWNNTSYEDE